MNVWKPYLETIKPNQQAIVLELMQAAKELLPEATEVLCYGMPTLKKGKDSIIAIAAYNNHIGVYPFGNAPVRLVELTMPKYVQTTKGGLRFPYEHLPTKENLKQIIDARLSVLGEQK